MNKIEGGVTSAKGFQAAGLSAGIKHHGKKDMAMIYSEVPCVAAGTFTTNKVYAGSVKWDRNVVYHSDFAQAVVVNSGVANACTGPEGYQNCQEMADATASALNIPADSVLIASTGVIGKQLPMDLIKAGIEKLPKELKATKENGTLAAQAVMTTDTVSKQVCATIDVNGTLVTIGYV